MRDLQCLGFVLGMRDIRLDQENFGLKQDRRQVGLKQACRVLAVAS